MATLYLLSKVSFIGYWTRLRIRQVIGQVWQRRFFLNASTNLARKSKSIFIINCCLVFLKRRKMLNQVAVEALYSATYLENYLDSVENLPNDLQRHISRMRQLDVDFQGRLAIKTTWKAVGLVSSTCNLFL